MATSIFLAKLIGPLALALGVALLVHGAGFRTIANEFLASPALIFLSGIITLPAGLAIVLTHNVWTTADWRVLVTIVGWLALVTGAVRMIAPQWVATRGRKIFANPMTPKIGAAIWLAVGAILCFYGYFR